MIGAPAPAATVMIGAPAATPPGLRLARRARTARHLRDVQAAFVRRRGTYVTCRRRSCGGAARRPQPRPATGPRRAPRRPGLSPTRGAGALRGRPSHCAGRAHRRKGGRGGRGGPLRTAAHAAAHGGCPGRAPPPDGAPVQVMSHESVRVASPALPGRRAGSPAAGLHAHLIAAAHC